MIETFTDWDVFFMEQAHLWARKSKDPSTKVGAVISNGKVFISGGMNGFASKVEDSNERLLDRETKYELTLHAELNAILFAMRDLHGHTLYTTHCPCARCAAVICQARIGKVVYLEGTEDFKSRWDGTLTFEQFKEAGVAAVEFPRAAYANRLAFRP